MKTPVIWMPVYIADVDNVAKGLTLEEEAIFHRLMRIYWVDGALPDERRIPVHLGISSQKWRSVRDIVLAAFQAYCERIEMDAQRFLSAENQARASEHGRKGANARWKLYRERELAKQPEVAMPEQCPGNSPSPSPSPGKVYNGGQTPIQAPTSTYDVEHYRTGLASTERGEAPRLMNGASYIGGRE